MYVMTASEFNLIKQFCREQFRLGNQGFSSNRPGAMCWVFDDKILIAGKRFLDSIRQFMSFNREHFKMISPHNFDLMTQLGWHNLIAATHNDKNQYCFKVCLTWDDYPHEFTVLCIPQEKLWDKPEDYCPVKCDMNDFGLDELPKLSFS